MSVFACICALVSGSLGMLCAVNARRDVVVHRRLKSGWRAGEATAAHRGGLEQAVLNRLVEYDLKRPSGPTGSTFMLSLPDGPDGLGSRLALAGVAGVRPSSAAGWRLRAACAGCAFGALFGALLSPWAAIAGFIGGGACGWSVLSWAVKGRIAQRGAMMERHISEAIEVICLGLRAGLSFERSLKLYCANFPTQLSSEFASAQQTWNCGLLTREQALRNLSTLYDSLVFSRVVDSIVRSLRFGSPLADNLEDLAGEARRSHRAKVEEEVMKAPVKMMVPIGLFILPSMLLLVMGPIMLELINGF